MAHQRQPSTTPTGTHAVSLRCLRLSRPSCASQTPLPSTNFGDGLDIARDASYAYPSSDPVSFPLTPLLTLPAAFGAAYVGETFRCTLCANCEVLPGEKRSVKGVRLEAELQVPGKAEVTALELVGGEEEEDEGGVLESGALVQRTVNHFLKEEGQHVLAVTVTYTETLLGEDGGASGGRARTFRKLYQFVAQQLVAVRSKITERKRIGAADLRSWILETQVENVGESSVVLERLWLTEREGLVGEEIGGGEKDALVLKPQDVEQVMFLLRENEKLEDDGSVRMPLAQLNIDWLSAMGEKGNLTTGWLASRLRP